MGCNHTRIRGMHYVPPFSSVELPIVLPTMMDCSGNVYHYINIGTQEWLVENLKTELYADGTPIPNITIDGFSDFFLPSKDEWEQIYINLYLYGIGNLLSSTYWSSSENSSTTAWGKGTNNGVDYNLFKNNSAIHTRTCRSFTSNTNYNLRDVGPAGGWIFWKNGNDYLELAPSDQDDGLGTVWSNIDSVSIGTTSTSIGEGQNNTNEIIAQAGHTNSAAKLCDDFIANGWVTDTTGAYCWYDNNITNKTSYGALYNWYAVNSIHGLAPTGWRIPSETDFEILKAYVGGDTIAGGKLKETGTSHWQSVNVGATDTYKFKAVGSGKRENDGGFDSITGFGWLWSSTEYTATHSYLLNIQNSTAAINSPQTYRKQTGLSVRCMRDIP